MGVRSSLGRMAAAVLLGAAGLVAVAGSAGAEADGKCATYSASSSAGGWVALQKSEQRGDCIKPGTGNALVMPGRTTAGISTTITCLYAPSDPHLEGNNDIFFTMLVTCQGGTPNQLFVYMDMARYLSGGGYVIDPASVVDDCVNNNVPGIYCISHTRCFQAGATYDGYAHLFGVDENWQLHEAEYYAAPRWIGCII